MTMTSGMLVSMGGMGMVKVVGALVAAILVVMLVTGGLMLLSAYQSVNGLMTWGQNLMYETIGLVTTLAEAGLGVIQQSIGALQAVASRISLVSLDIYKQEMEFVMLLAGSCYGMAVDGMDLMILGSKGALQITREAMGSVLQVVTDTCNTTTEVVGSCMMGFAKMFANIQQLVDYLNTHIVVPVLTMCLGITQAAVAQVLQMVQQFLPMAFNGLTSLQHVLNMMNMALGPQLTVMMFMGFYMRLVNYIVSKVTGVKASVETLMTSTLDLVEDVPSQVAAAIASIVIDWQRVGSVSLCDVVANAIVGLIDSTGLYMGPISTCKGQVAQFAIYHLTGGAFCRGRNVNSSLASCLFAPINFTIVPRFTVGISMPSPIPASASFSFGSYTVNDLIGLSSLIESVVNSLGTTIGDNHVPFQQIPNLLLDLINSEIIDAAKAAANAIFQTVCNAVRSAVVSGCRGALRFCDITVSFFGTDISMGWCTTDWCDEAVPSSCPSIPFELGGF